MPRLDAQIFTKTELDAMTARTAHVWVRRAVRAAFGASRQVKTAAKYDHIDFKPPASVARAAERGLEYRRRQKGDKAGLSTGEAAAQGIGSGVQRAVNLKNRDTMSPATVRRMSNFFSRHQKNKSIDPKHRGEPWKDKGYVAWLLWGGDPGRSWASKIVRQMDAADKSKTASSRSRCMHDGCKKGPEIEVIWADGRGRAWFCKPHFTSWKNEKTEMPRDIVREREVPDGVVGEKFGEYPKNKTAKATGTKCGDGESVGLFIPLPKNLAKKFPSLGQEDTSPSHVTFLYIGDFKGSAKQEELVGVLKDVCRRWWPACKAVLGDLQYFDHEDKDRRVPHVCVEFDKDLSSFRHRVKQELTDAGIEVGDRFPEYKPHVTLAYMPGMDSEWKGKVPKGSWSFDKMEVWGLPKVHRLQLGPSIKKISDEWLARRVAIRHAVRKVAGWWAITPGNPGINPPPVDKGGLVNAIPGTDPETARYNGDGPADIMGAAFEDVNGEYLREWGRPATPEEMEAVFDFVFGGFESEPSHYLPEGVRP